MKIPYTLLLLPALLLTSSISIAQNINYQWVGQVLGANIYARHIATDTYNHVYITGDYVDSVSVPGDTIRLTEKGVVHTFLAQYDQNGTAKWLRDMGKGSVTDIITDNSGNIYVSVFFSGDTLQLQDTALVNLHQSPYGNEIIFILKLDNNGRFQWGKTIYGDYFNSLAIDAANNIYVGGEFYDDTIFIGPYPLYNHGGTDLFIAKYNAQGQVQWAQSYGGDWVEDLYDLACDPQGNIYFTSLYKSDSLTIGSTTFTHPGSRIVGKLNTAGHLTWLREFQSAALYNPYNIAVGPSGQPYVSGTVHTSGSLVIGPDTIPPGNLGPDAIAGSFIMQLNSSGATTWLRGIPMSSSIAAFTNLATGINGEVYLTVPLDEPHIADTFFYNTPLNGAEKIQVKEYDSTGIATGAWLITGPDWKETRDIATGNHNDLYLAGNFTGDTAIFNDKLLFRTAPPLSFSTYIAKIGPAFNTVINSISNNNLILYPNPTTGHLHLATGYEPTTYRIFNTLGQPLTGSQPYSTGMGIDVSILPSGLYILQATTSTGIGTTRFIKQ